MLKAVLFDMGSTLLQRDPPDEPVRFRQMNDALHAAIAARYPAVRLPAPAAFDALITTLMARHRPVHTRDALLGHLVAATGWPLDPRDTALLTAWHAPLIAATYTEPDLPATLDRLRARGLRLGIVSNTGWRMPWRDRELAHAGILGYFPVRIYSSDLEIEKPDPRIFAAAITALGAVAPAEVLYVGDHLEGDVGGAQRAGLRAAWLVPAGTPALPVGAGVQPDLILHTLAQLPAQLAAHAAF